MLQNVCEAGDDLMWEVIKEQDLRFKDTLDSHDVDPTDALTAEIIGHTPVLSAIPQELSTETTTRMANWSSKSFSSTRHRNLHQMC